MKNFTGILNGTIIFPDYIKDDKAKCEQLLQKLLDEFIETLEINDCEIFCTTNVVAD